MNLDTFGSRGTLDVGDARYEIYRLSAVDGLARLPYSLKVLAENLLRTEDGANVTAAQIEAIHKSGRIAVKVINHLGDEVMKVFKV